MLDLCEGWPFDITAPAEAGERKKQAKEQRKARAAAKKQTRNYLKAQRTAPSLDTAGDTAGND